MSYYVTKLFYIEHLKIVCSEKANKLSKKNCTYEV